MRSSRNLVVGVGEMGTAVALSLVAGGKHAQVCIRDPTTLLEMQGSLDKKTSIMWPAKGLHTRAKPMLLPEQPSRQHLNFADATKLQEAVAQHKQEFGVPVRSISICVPSTQVREVAEQLAPIQDQLEETPLILFSRGLSAEGETPVDIASSVLPKVPLVVASGPLIGRSWATTGSAAIEILNREAGKEQYEGETTVLERHLNSIKLQVSPTLLCFGATPKTNFEARDNVEKAFMREAPRWLPVTNPDHEEAIERFGGEAQILSLVNAIASAVSFGSGMLSSQHGGDPAAASTFYHHALSATERLVADALQVRSWQAPPEVASTLMSAVCNNSSQEYACGRKQDFYFTQNEVMRHSFSTNSETKKQLQENFEGLYMFNKKKTSKKHPFLESLVTGFETFHRPSVWALNAVKSDNYAWLTEDPPKSEVQQAVEHLDKVITERDGVGYDEAQQRIEELIGGGAMHPQRVAGLRRNVGDDGEQ